MMPSSRRAAVRARVLACCGLIWLAAAATAVAEPVRGWSFATWSASPAAVKAGAGAAKLSAMPVSADDAAMFGLPRSTVPFAFQVEFYGEAAVAYPIFLDDELDAIRFVLADPSTCRTVLDGLTADFGPGSKDERGFANINWPTTERFGLTVVVTDYQCWPLFSRPGV